MGEAFRDPSMAIFEEDLGPFWAACPGIEPEGVFVMETDDGTAVALYLSLGFEPDLTDHRQGPIWDSLFSFLVFRNLGHHLVQAGFYFSGRVSAASPPFHLPTS